MATAPTHWPARTVPASALAAACCAARTRTASLRSTPLGVAALWDSRKHPMANVYRVSYIFDYKHLTVPKIQNNLDLPDPSENNTK